MNKSEYNYFVDVVLCIDKTADMRIFADGIRRMILSLPQKFEETFLMVGKPIDTLRMKIIAFSDYMFGDNPMSESPFFVIPEQNEEFINCLDSISYAGGGDIAENGLEAFATAIKSDWTTGGDRQRHIIMMFSNAPALPLGERSDCLDYPKDLPKDMNELASWWEGTDGGFEGTYLPRAGRLVAFVPNDPSWRYFENFSRYFPIYINDVSSEGTNLDEIIQLISGGF